MLSNPRPRTVLSSQTQAQTHSWGRSVTFLHLPCALGIRHSADPILEVTGWSGRRRAEENQREGWRESGWYKGPAVARGGSQMHHTHKPRGSRSWMSASTPLGLLRGLQPSVSCRSALDIPRHRISPLSNVREEGCTTTQWDEPTPGGSGRLALAGVVVLGQEDGV